MKEEDIDKIINKKVNSILEKITSETEFTENEKSILELMRGDIKYLNQAKPINQIWDKHYKRLPKTRKISYLRISSITAASVALLIGFYFLFMFKSANNIEFSEKHAIMLTIERQNDEKIEIPIVDLKENKYGDIVKKDSIIEYADTTEVCNDEYHKLSVGQGMRYVVKLADGTTVNLNSNSYIRYPAKFTGNIREVEFSGDAFFNVAKDKSKTFIVKCGAFRVDVIGTSFNIMNYKEEAIPKVSLTEGCLQVSRNKEKHVLKAGEQAILYEDVIKIKPININHYLNSDSFVFSEDSFGYIARSIKRWYGIDIIFEDKSIQNMLYTGTIPKYQDVAKLIEALELTTNIQILRKNANTYIIRKIKLNQTN